MADESIAHVLLGRDDGQLGLYKTSGECVTLLEGHSDWILALDVDWHWMRALSAGGDGAIFLWDLAVGSVVNLTHDSGVRGCIRAIAVEWIDPKEGIADKTEETSSNGLKKSWSASKIQSEASPLAQSLPGERPARSPSMMSNSPSHAGLSPTGSRKRGTSRAKVVKLRSSRALSGSDDGKLVLWNLREHRLEKIYEPNFNMISAIGVEWSSLRALIGHGDSGLDLYDLEDSCWLRSFAGHTCLVTTIHVRWSKSLALCGSGDAALILWDVKKATPLHSLKGHSGGISAAQVHWHSMRAVTGASDHTVRLWNLKHGSCIRTFSSLDHPIRAISVDWSTGIALVASANGEGAPLMWAFGETSEQPKELQLQFGEQQSKASTSVVALQSRQKSQVVIETETT